jgi:hypothetical protein
MNMLVIPDASDAVPQIPIYEPRAVDGSIWTMIQSLAPTIHESRLFKVASPQQAAAIMLKGHELGLSLAASFEFIHNINGQIGVSPRGALALIHQSPLVDVIEINDEADRCTVTMQRRDTGFRYTSSFSLEDAGRAGLLKDDSGWAKYPANMLRWRAIGYCADVVAPDVLAGMKRADELGAAIDREGNVVSSEVVS